MKPIVTRALIGANVLAFVLFSPYTPYAQEIFGTLGLVPGDFQIWQPLTSLFLHGGFIHLAFNMIALWSLGPAIERELGAVKFTLLYFASGLTGALAVLVLPGMPFVPTVGASGAIVGLMGALAVFYPNASIAMFFVPMRARTAALAFGGITILLMLVDQGSGISHAGHLGGLIGGLALSKYLQNSRIGATRRFDWGHEHANPYSRPMSRGRTETRPAEVQLIYDPATGRYYLNKRLD